MKTHGLALAAALLGAAALGITPASAVDQFKVTPPAGWEKIAPKSDAILASWVAPNQSGFRQNLNLISEQYSGSLTEYVATAIKNIKRSATDVELGPEVDVKTCSDQPAKLLAWKSTVFGRKLVFVEAISIWFDRAYILTYTHEEGQTPNDDAAQSLATLCVRQI